MLGAQSQDITHQMICQKTKKMSIVDENANLQQPSNNNNETY